MFSLLLFRDNGLEIALPFDVKETYLRFFSFSIFFPFSSGCRSEINSSVYCVFIRRESTFEKLHMTDMRQFVMLFSCHGKDSFLSDTTYQVFLEFFLVQLLMLEGHLRMS